MARSSGKHTDIFLQISDGNSFSYITKSLKAGAQLQQNTSILKPQGHMLSQKWHQLSYNA